MNRFFSAILFPKKEVITLSIIAAPLSYLIGSDLVSLYGIEFNTMRGNAKGTYFTTYLTLLSMYIPSRFFFLRWLENRKRAEREYK